MTNDQPAPGPQDSPDPVPDPGSPPGTAPDHSTDTTSAPTAPTAPTGGSGPTWQGTDDFFDRIRASGLRRPEEGRWIAGVAEGLSRRWDVDPLLVRGGFVALSLLGGIGVVGYGLAWLLLPQDDGRIHLQQAIRGDFTAGFVGALLLSMAAVIGGTGSWQNGWWFPSGLLLTGLIIFAFWWLADRSNDNRFRQWPTGPDGKSTDWAAVGQQASEASRLAGQRASEASRLAGQRASEASRLAGQRASEASRRFGEASRTQALARRERSRPSKPLRRLTLGLALLVAAGAVLVSDAANWDAPIGLIAAASALVVIGVGVIISGLLGRRPAGMAALGILLAVGTLLGIGVQETGVRTGQNLVVIGSEEWRPSSVEEAESQFNLGLGEATLWLTDPRLLASAAAEPVDVRARIGAGEVTLVVPDDVSVRVDLILGEGELITPDGRISDLETRQERQLTVGPAGPPKMIVDVQLGVGTLEIQTSTRAALPAAPTPRPSLPTNPAPNPTTSPAPAAPAPTVTPIPTATPTAAATN